MKRFFPFLVMSVLLASLLFAVALAPTGHADAASIASYTSTQVLVETLDDTFCQEADSSSTYTFPELVCAGSSVAALIRPPKGLQIALPGTCISYDGEDIAYAQFSAFSPF